MLISNELKLQIPQFIEEFKKTGKDSFEFDSESFPNVKLFFNRKPQQILFPLGEIEGVQVYVGNDEK